MKRIIFAIIMMVLFFLLLNFIRCNLDDQTFMYSMVFKFTIPGIVTYQSVPLPMGFVLLVSFCCGMVTIAILEALPSFLKTLELRSKNKKIRQLERELTAMRDLHQSNYEPPTSREDRDLEGLIK